MLKVIRGAPPARLPLADPCQLCRGRRVLVQGSRITPCPVCSTPRPPATYPYTDELAPLDAIARAA